LFKFLYSIDFIVSAHKILAQAKENSITLFFTTFLNFIIEEEYI
jgi:hypothetical protein